MHTRKEFEATYPVFQRLLLDVEVPGMPGASWDRKACHLYMCALEGVEPNRRAPGEVSEKVRHPPVWADEEELDTDGY